MDFETPKSKVYIQTDDQGRILRCEGGYTTPTDLTDWTYIDEGTGDRYNLCQSHYFDGGLYTLDGIPRYKWDGEQAVERTEEEPQNVSSTFTVRSVDRWGNVGSADSGRTRK